MNRFKSSLNYICHKLTQKWTLVGALFVAAALSSVAVFASAKTEELRVHFFDVGQGDAIFIELPDGRQILIDGGPDDRVLEKLNSLMPFWDRSIDIVVATHADADHITGLVPVIAHYEVGAVIWNGIEAETEIFKEWKEAVAIEEADVITGRCCMRFTLSEDTFFDILHPINMPGSDPQTSLPYEGGGRGGQNNYSLVIRFVYGDDSLLFTGDIERQAEYDIVRQNFNLESDVLKVPHHGSKTSSSEIFLEAVRPGIAVISAGRNNPYGHPHEAILQRMSKYGIEIRRIDTEGDVLLNF